ncbi:MAG TPA: Xaa-Pro peptidase family protein [Ignavibacteriaceae bacterium]|nr:Xaa-Pro peptidase family protein [Ignavibacteriaceae bacterium]
MSDSLIKEKIGQAVKILNEKDIDMWLTFVRESSTAKDPILEMIAGINFTWQSALIINKDGDTTAIVGSIEIDNLKNLNLYKNVTGYVQSIRESLTEYLKKKNPQKIAINFSKNSVLADGLTHGMFLILQDYLKEINFENRVISSEEIISSLRGRKSPVELSIMRDAVKETLRIFDEVSNYIKPGVSEVEIADYIKALVKVDGYELAWDEDHCPAVFTGPDTQGAHSGPTERKVEKGHLVNIDFGIKYNGYCSDLQRTWYVLKDDEDKAPIDVEIGFSVIRDSIQKVADNLKPGVQGCEMDDIARNFIVKSGYEDFPHGLGHQVGRNVHDGGGGLLPRWERYGNTPFMKVEESQVYTIEPRLKVDGFGTATIEEEVFVTKEGCEFISKPQKELMLIRGD